MNELLAAYRHLSNNHAQIEASTVCGCCHCVRLFKPQEIVGWTGLTVETFNDPRAIAAQTAMCPHCGSEAVLGDGCGLSVNGHLLARMNEAWFQATQIRRTTVKA